MDHWADYVIFVVFLLASLGIGLYHALTGGRQRTTQEFISGNRQLKGGMKAVIWTDVFQFLIMLGGCLAILIRAVILAGGVNEVFHLAEIEGRLDWFDWRAWPTVRHSFWAISLGYGIADVYTFGFQQASYQRYSAVPTIGKARLTMAVSFVSNILMQCLFCATGVAVVGYYSKIKCDVLSSGLVKSPNQILPFFVVEAFKGYKGFNGLFIATLYGGALSSVSSSLSGSAANVWSDLLKPHLPHISDTRAALINRILVAVLGLISIAVAFLPTVIKAPILQIAMAFFGACGGPLLGMFFLSGCRCLKNKLLWQVVVVGGLVGLCLNIWLSLGANFNQGLHPMLPPMSAENCSILGLSNFTLPETSLLSNSTDSQSTTEEVSGVLRFYKVSYMWYAVFGAVSSIFVGWIISIIIGICKKMEGTYTPPNSVYFNLADSLINRHLKDNNGSRQKSVEMQDKVIYEEIQQ